MKYLLDTHILLWWLEKSSRLPKSIQEIIETAPSLCAISSISFAEMATKHAVGKMKIPQDNFDTLCTEEGFTPLYFSMAHAQEMVDMPLIHKDPFDRMIIAQAKREGLTLITADEEIWKYNIPLVKAL